MARSLILSFGSAFMVVSGLFMVWCATVIAPSMTYPHTALEYAATCLLFGGIASMGLGVQILCGAALTRV